MQKIPASRLLLATSLLALPAALWSLSAIAAPSKSSSKSALKRVASAPKASKKNSSAAKLAPLPPADQIHISLQDLKREQRLRKEAMARKNRPMVAGLQPYWEGHALTKAKPMKSLLDGPSFEVPPSNQANAKKGGDPLRIAQAFPRQIPPANPGSIRRPATTIPRWVRYPLEFQLAGIGIGSRAVDKDRFNRIDRYGLFALHGNPTAVVRSVILLGGGGAGGAGGAAGGAPGAPGGTGGATPGGAPGGLPGGAGGTGQDAGGVATGAGQNLTLQQQPPEVAALFPQTGVGGGLPDWALAITVKLDANHVEWLYKRDTYAMGFVVDRLGFVDAIIVAGLQSDIATTQMEDPVHTVKLGDDLRKVLFRYGYPDDLVPLAQDPPASVNDTTGGPPTSGGTSGAAAQGGAPGGAGGVPGAPGAVGGAGGDAGADPNSVQGTNSAFRTYDLRYEQSYNIVFTIRNNRVVRIYIFGDPDFFNAQRRNDLRRKY